MAIQQSNDGGLRELALFAGAGGGILGGYLLGWRTVCAVERDAYAAQVLAQRQNDGILRTFPIWSDVTTFDGRPWHGIVNVISGGFPCQDISVAGKGAGITGNRSGLWKQFDRIIGEVEPEFVYVENSPAITIRGLGVVLGDLAARGYDAEWRVLSCADVGGVHLRERAWIVATNSKIMHGNVGADNREHSERKIPESGNGYCETDAARNDSKRTERQREKQIYRFRHFPWGEDVRRIEDLRNRPDIPQPLIRRIGDDVACGVDRLKAIGNGQVPRVAATAFNMLCERMK